MKNAVPFLANRSHGHLLFYVTLKQNVLNFSYKKRDLSMLHFNSHVFKYT